MVETDFKLAEDKVIDYMAAGHNICFLLGKATYIQSKSNKFFNSNTCLAGINSFKRLIETSAVPFEKIIVSIDEKKEKIQERMTEIKLEIKRMAKEGKEICLFFVYCGHGVEIDNQTHAVMENGVEFINIKKFILSCAKQKDCLVLGVLDCCREIISRPQSAEISSPAERPKPKRLYGQYKILYSKQYGQEEKVESGVKTSKFVGEFHKFFSITPDTLYPHDIPLWKFGVTSLIDMQGKSEYSICFTPKKGVLDSVIMKGLQEKVDEFFSKNSAVRESYFKAKEDEQLSFGRDYEDPPANRVFKQWHKVGNNYEQGEYYNGISDGRCIVVSPNNQIMIARWKADQKHGTCFIIWQNGRRSRQEMVNNKEHGKKEEIYTDGTILNHFYDDGIKYPKRSVIVRQPHQPSENLMLEGLLERLAKNFPQEAIRTYLNLAATRASFFSDDFKNPPKRWMQTWNYTSLTKTYQQSEQEPSGQLDGRLIVIQPNVSFQFMRKQSISNYESRPYGEQLIIFANGEHMISWFENGVEISREKILLSGETMAYSIVNGKEVPGKHVVSRDQFTAERAKDEIEVLKNELYLMQKYAEGQTKQLTTVESQLKKFEEENSFLMAQAQQQADKAQEFTASLKQMFDSRQNYLRSVLREDNI